MFVNNDFRRWFLENIGFKVTNKNYTSTLENTLDELADSLEENLNINKILKDQY
jgi:cobyric acid synthase